MALLTLPTADRIREIILGRMLGSPAIQQGDTAKGGFLWQLANAFARQGRNLLVRALALQDQCLPTRATGDPLVWWSETVLGEGAAEATPWVGTIEVRCVNNTQTVPSGQTGAHEDGTAYATTVTINPTDWVSAGAYYYCRIAAHATTLGSDGNKAANTPITLASPPAGVYDVAYLYSTTTEGADAETETENQSRIGQHLRDMPGGGSCAEFRAWCQEVDGIYDACVYPRWNGVGLAGDNSVRCILLGPPGDRLLAAYPTAVADVTTHLADRAPLFASSVTVALPLAVDQRVALTVRCDDGYFSDYSDLGYAPNVTGFDASLRRIDLSVDPTGNLQVGYRVVVHCADARSYQMVVQSVGVGYIIVEDTWTSNPSLAAMRAGGPLWQPIRDAVEAVFDGLGSSHSDTVGKSRWPDSRYEMPSTLHVSDLCHAIESIEGVMAVTITAPAADTTTGVAENVAPAILRLAGTGGNADLTVTWSVTE